MSAAGGAATILNAVGGNAPVLSHRVVVLLRRIAAFTSLTAIVLLACVAMALGSGRDLIADYKVNGQITGCYTAREFRDALKIARADEVLYGNAIEAILEARATNTAGPDGTCAAVSAPTPVEENDGGSGAGLWIGLAVAVGLIAVGAGLWARRAGDDDDTDDRSDDANRDGGDGPEPPARD